MLKRVFPAAKALITGANRLKTAFKCVFQSAKRTNTRIKAMKTRYRAHLQTKEHTNKGRELQKMAKYLVEYRENQTKKPLPELTDFTFIGQYEAATPQEAVLN